MNASRVFHSALKKKKSLLFSEASTDDDNQSLRMVLSLQTFVRFILFFTLTAVELSDFTQVLIFVREDAIDLRRALSRRTIGSIMFFENYFRH